MNERKNNLRPASKNTIDYIFNKVKDKTEVFILFGSVAYGLEREESDIDILIIGDKKIKEEKLEVFPKRIEFHFVTKEQLEKMNDFVILEAIMNGIVYKGEIFELLCGLKRFPKAYVLFRLHKAKEHLLKASKLKGHAKEYYQELARVSLGEIEALLFKKKILPKKLIKLTSTLESLEEKISKEGEFIWLT
jgi:predicted nucleotidyltransferase